MNRIMVVDDEAVIITQLEEYLTNMGYNVVGSASSGKEAIEMARQLRPDIILMDIVMPGGLDGIGAAEVINEEFNIPVIFLTAYADDKFINRAKNAEPYGYIVKPFQEKEIKAVIEIAIYKKEADKELLMSEMWYRNTIELSNDGIAIAQDGKLSFVNKKFAELLEYSPEELHGKDFYEILADINASFVRELHEKRMMGKKAPNIFQAELLTKSGKRIPIEANCTIAECEGQLAELMYIRDLRERSKVEHPVSLFLCESGRLTERQRTIIQTALNKGFYEYPKKIGLEGLANEFNISISTTAEIIHRGEKNILKQYFGVG